MFRLFFGAAIAKIPPRSTTEVRRQNWAPAHQSARTEKCGRNERNRNEVKEGEKPTGIIAKCAKSATMGRRKFWGLHFVIEFNSMETTKCKEGKSPKAATENRNAKWMHLSSPARAEKWQNLLKGIATSDKGRKVGCKQSSKRGK